MKVTWARAFGKSFRGRLELLESEKGRFPDYQAFFPVVLSSFLPQMVVPSM